MWADTLLELERAHLLRLTAWGALSVVAGTALIAFRTMRRLPAPALLHFAVQCAAWGAVVLVVAVLGWTGLGLRDLDGAIRLTNRLWMNAGLAIGYTAVGVTLASCAWVFGRRPAPLGAGAGVIVQGVVLLTLELVFISSLSLAAFDNG